MAADDRTIRLDYISTRDPRSGRSPSGLRSWHAAKCVGACSDVCAADHGGDNCYFGLDGQSRPSGRATLVHLASTARFAPPPTPPQIRVAGRWSAKIKVNFTTRHLGLYQLPCRRPISQLGIFKLLCAVVTMPQRPVVGQRFSV